MKSGRGGVESERRDNGEWKEGEVKSGRRGVKSVRRGVESGRRGSEEWKERE